MAQSAQNGGTKADREWLNEQAGVLRTIFRRSADDIVRIGEVVIGVRNRLGHGRFMEWSRAELPWSHRQTIRVMQVARAFGYTFRHGVQFEPSALYALSQPSVPKPAREYALELAADGQKITKNVAESIVRDWRRVPVPVPKSHSRKKAKAAVEAPQMPPSLSVAAGLLAGGAIVHLAASEDEGDVQFDATLYSDGKVRHASGDNLGEVILRVAGKEPAKLCTKCDELQPMTSFSRNKASPDGRNRYCKRCERKRLKEFKNRKRLAASPKPVA